MKIARPFMSKLELYRKDLFQIKKQVMRVTKWIVLPLLPKVLYKLGFFEGIVKSGKTIRQISRMIFKVALKRFCMSGPVLISVL